MNVNNGNAISPPRNKTSSSSRRRFLFAALGFLLAAVAVLSKKILDFLGYAPESGQEAPFAIKQPDAFPYHERNVWIMKDDNGLFALGGTCPHLGCKPNWIAGEQRFVCPCHKSVFSADGSRLGGPTPTGLKHLRMDWTKSGQIRIDPLVTVTDSFRLPLKSANG